MNWRARIAYRLFPEREHAIEDAYDRGFTNGVRVGQALAKRAPASDPLTEPPEPAQFVAVPDESAEFDALIRMTWAESPIAQSLTRARVKTLVREKAPRGAILSAIEGQSIEIQ